MTTLRSCLFALTALVVTTAHAVEYKHVQLNKSTVGFISKQMNVPVEGMFKKFSAQISFDPAKPLAGSASIEINIASIDAGSEEANTELKRKAWFDTQNFPSAHFVSSQVKPLGNNKYEALGKMTIKGTTHNVTVPFTVSTQGNNAQIDGSIPILRLQYNIGGGVWSDTDTVADEVIIKFKFLLAAS